MNIFSGFSNEITLEITLKHGCSPVNMLIFSEHLFLKTPLDGSFSNDPISIWVITRLTSPSNFKRVYKNEWSNNPSDRLSVTLRYCVSGNTQTTIVASYRISSSNIRRIMTETCGHHDKFFIFDLNFWAIWLINISSAKNNLIIKRLFNT